MSTHVVQEDQKNYELMAVIKPDIGDDAIKARLEKLRELIISTGGSVTHEEHWGLRDLTYRIKKQDRGFYCTFDFSGDPSKLKEMDRVLRLDNELLRHLLTILPTGYEAKDYFALAAAEAEAAAAQAGDEALMAAPKRALKKETKVEPAAPEKAEKKEEAPAKAIKEKAPKKKEQTLEDVDAKLKSIIDNPDLNF